MNTIATRSNLPILTAEFTTLLEAQAYRALHGGWLFHANSGEVIWFDGVNTPTMIFNHRATRGLSGSLL